MACSNQQSKEVNEGRMAGAVEDWWRSLQNGSLGIAKSAPGLQRAACGPVCVSSSARDAGVKVRQVRVPRILITGTGGLASTQEVGGLITNS